MAGDDLRDLPLHVRKDKLERLLDRRPDGITVAPFERGEIGPGIRDDKRVRLLSRNGLDWTKRYPGIAEAALKNRQKQFAIDGEAVVVVYRAACRMRLEGLVSKRRDRPYRGRQAEGLAEGEEPDSSLDGTGAVMAYKAGAREEMKKRLGVTWASPDRVHDISHRRALV